MMQLDRNIFQNRQCLAIWHHMVSFVMAHHMTCPEHTIEKYVKNAATHKQQKSEPGWLGNLCCCLAVGLADLMFFPLHVLISRKELQQLVGLTVWHFAIGVGSQM